MTIAMPSGATALPHWGLLRARGADTVAFLQGQLTNDVASMAVDEARLAGFCSAKGRLQASFVMWRGAADEVVLACSASVLAATRKRLSMFVLRAKVTIADATAELPLRGLAGDAAAAVVGTFRVWERGEAGGLTTIRLPDADGVPRALQAAPADASGAGALPPAEASGVAERLLSRWQWLEVRSGIPTIEAATADRFVPQMLNYELLGGVDFRKGCYPGQEVVARSQYRGTIKRRMFLFDLDAETAPGQEVFHSADPGQPAGLVVNAAARPASASFGALVEVKTAALDSGTLHLGEPGGPLLTRADLPYALPVDSAEPA